MNTYTKFLVRTYLSSFLNVFFIFFCLIYILNLLTELEFFKQTNVKAFFPLYLSLINTPILVFEMFPFIFLISTQFFFNTLFTDNEMNIFKYSGLKNTKIFSILAITTFFVGVLIISVFYNLSSNLKNFYLEMKSPYTTDGKYLAVITKNGLWIKDEINDKVLIINSSKIEENFLINSFITEFNKDFSVIRNLRSKKIDISKNEWVAYNVRVYDKNNYENQNKLIIKTNFDYKKIKTLYSNLSSLNIFQLYELRKNYIKLNYSITDVNLQLLKLIVYPIFLLLITIFASIIMFNSKHIKGTTFKISIGLFFSVIIYYLNNFFYVLASSERIPIIISILTPLVILTLINTIMFNKIDEK